MMDVEEVISISDSESSRHSARLPKTTSEQLQQHNCKKYPSETKITISSNTNASSLKCPVSWSDKNKKPFKYLDPESFLSPSPRTKVSSWLYENCQNNSNPHLQGNFPPAYSDNKSSILIRQDYQKPLILNNCTSIQGTSNSGLIETNLISRSSSVNSEIIRISSNSSNSKDQTINLNSTALDISKINSNKQAKEVPILFDSPNQFEIDSENKLMNSPANLDIPNKVELCEYLKLMNMNPIDGTTAGSKQNRRSSRVKNLALMSEKRALERELNSDASSCEKRKSTNGLDQDIKSLTSSESSKGSTESSKVRNGPLPHIAKPKTNNKKDVSSQQKVDEKCRIRNILGIPDHFKNYNTRTKSLQVPEVSTTCVTKSKPEKIQKEDKENNKSANESVNRNGSKVCLSNNNKKSFITPKTSLSQLNINFNAAPTSKHHKLGEMKNLLLNFMSVFEQNDFEESFKQIFSAVEIEQHFQTKENVQNFKDKESKKPLKNMQNAKDQESKRRLKKKNLLQDRKSLIKNKTTLKLKALDKFSKSHIRQKHKIKRAPTAKSKNTTKSCLQPKQTFHSYSRNLTKLRSRSKLKNIGIRSILMKHDKKKKSKRFRTTKLLTQALQKQRYKEFRETILIQSTEKAPEKVNVVDEQHKNDVFLPPADYSPFKILKLKSEIDLLKNITPEHRKSLFESKKFLLMKSRENMKPPCNNTVVDTKKKENEELNETDVIGDVEVNSIEMEVDLVEKVSFVEKVDKTTDTTEDCDTKLTLPKLVHVEQQTQTDYELSRPTSEDLEVHKLMSSGYFEDQLVQPKSSSIKVDSLIKNAINAVLKDKWRNPLLCKSTSSSASSFPSVDNNHSPTSERSKSGPYVSESSLHGEVESSNIAEQSEKISCEEDNECENQPEIVDISNIQPTEINCIQLVDDSETTIKSLHQCLTQTVKKTKDNINKNKNDDQWSPRSERKTSQSYAIHLSSENGAVLNAYYLDYNLIIVQEYLISFWNQTPLGNVLGVQDMWMPKGDTKRIVLGNGCSHKECSESVMVLEKSVAYVELWTKEHKSDKRERPVADVFVTIYLRLNGSGPDKKVLQLENIHGYANDVQYIVLKNSPYIIVSWNTVNDQLTSTAVHKYELSSDYQKVANIVAMQTTAHYIVSLHNIEDSDTLIMGCGEDKITLWHVEHGYIVATMDLMAIAQQPRTLWSKADRGFIFTLHNFNDGYFHLIATNSFDYSWKQLQIYKQDLDNENLLGICVENGFIIAFYDTRMLCWNAKSGDLVIDGSCEGNIFLPFGKHIVMMIENQVHVRHVLEYLVVSDDT